MSKNKIGLNLKRRILLKKLLRKGYSIKTLVDETGITLHTLRKEVMQGTTSENFKKGLYGSYEPERVLYTNLIDKFSKEEIDAFIEWYKEKKKRNEI